MYAHETKVKLNGNTFGQKFSYIELCLTENDRHLRITVA